MIRVLFVLLSLTFAHSFSQAQTSEDDKAIIKLFRDQEVCWNMGDINCYVELYAPVDSVRMLWNTGSVYGKDSILAFYKKYWPKERMGQLTLDQIRSERLSSEYYFVTGRFTVAYTNGNKSVVGRFSGLMKKIKGRWYIYTDHSG